MIKRNTINDMTDSEIERLADAEEEGGKLVCPYCGGIWPNLYGEDIWEENRSFSAVCSCGKEFIAQTRIQYSFAACKRDEDLVSMFKEGSSRAQIAQTKKVSIECVDLALRRALKEQDATE